MTFIYRDVLQKDRQQTLQKNQSDAEKILWKYLRKKQLCGLKFYRQYTVGPFVLDFFCPELRIAIEVDGGERVDPKTALREGFQRGYLERRDIQVLRFWNTEVLRNVDGALEIIHRAVAPPNLPF